MAGRITVSTLNDDTGVLATQNGMSGIAKAWVNFNGTGTPAIRASFNVSSITDNGTGLYTVNFTTAMPDVNYATSCLTSGFSDADPKAFVSVRSTSSASAVSIVTSNVSGTLNDLNGIYLAIFR
jgi:hypothetical protein